MMKFTFTMFVWKVMFSICLWKFVPAVCEKLEESSPGSDLCKTVYSCEHKELLLNCDEDRFIYVIRANYGRLTRDLCNYGDVVWSGRDCVSDSSTLIVNERCHLKKSCSIPASNIIFGDPCQGTIKYLEVQYICVPRWNFTDISEQSSSPKPVSEPVATLGFSLPQIVYSCEHSELHLSCKEDRVIHIIQANYGRLTGNLCNEDGQVKWSGKRCVAQSTYDVLVDRCDQKQSCYVLASNTVFGDPCHGTIKYLQVQYNCVSHHTTGKPAISSTSIPTDLDYKSDITSTVHESFDDTMEENEIENAKDAPLPDLDATLLE